MAPNIDSRLCIGGVILDNQTQDKYILRKKLGKASLATVFKAEYIPKGRSTGRRVALRTFVALKVIPMGQFRACMTLVEELERSYKPRDHNNIVGLKKWFMSDGLFGVVMHYMDEGSLGYIVSQRFKNGMPEDCIQIALRDALRGLSFVHGKGRVHKCFSAGNIFVNSNPTAIMLACEASMYKHDPEDIIQSIDTEEASTSALPPDDKITWAPEAYKLKRSRDYKQSADIWLVGVTALELAYGCLPVTDREGFNAIIKKITKKNKLPTLGELIDASKGINVSKGKRLLNFLEKKLKALKGSREKEERLFSKDFEQMVIKCLAERPEKRPTAEELLQTEFLRNYKGLRYFQQIVVKAKKLLSTIMEQEVMK